MLQLLLLGRLYDEFDRVEVSACPRALLIADLDRCVRVPARMFLMFVYSVAAICAPAIKHFSLSAARN